MVRPFDRSRDLEHALLNPGAVFVSPEQVVQTPQLSRAEKIDILRRWSYDAGELAVAEEEGMAGGEPTLVDRILAALDHLGSTEGPTPPPPVPPTKHGR